MSQNRGLLRRDYGCPQRVHRCPLRHYADAGWRPRRRIGSRQEDDERAGGIKKSRQSLLRELYRENTPVGVDGFEPPTLCL